MEFIALGTQQQGWNRMFKDGCKNDGGFILNLWEVLELQYSKVKNSFNPNNKMIELNNGYYMTPGTVQYIETVKALNEWGLLWQKKNNIKDGLNLITTPYFSSFRKGADKQMLKDGALFNVSSLKIHNTQIITGKFHECKDKKVEQLTKKEREILNVLKSKNPKYKNIPAYKGLTDKQIIQKIFKDTDKNKQATKKTPLKEKYNNQVNKILSKKTLNVSDVKEVSKILIEFNKEDLGGFNYDNYQARVKTQLYKENDIKNKNNDDLYEKIGDRIYRMKNIDNAELNNVNRRAIVANVSVEELERYAMIEKKYEYYIDKCSKFKTIYAETEYSKNKEECVKLLKPLKKLLQETDFKIGVDSYTHHQSYIPKALFKLLEKTRWYNVKGMQKNLFYKYRDALSFKKSLFN
tara:strand:- start:934 stop:2154 length:1221 start_codon:yes stop_codon:yes gene_type:complete